jgi:hypothetical protein
LSVCLSVSPLIQEWLLFFLTTHVARFGHSWASFPFIVYHMYIQSFLVT